MNGYESGRLSTGRTLWCGCHKGGCWRVYGGQVFFFFAFWGLLCRSMRKARLSRLPIGVINIKELLFRMGILNRGAPVRLTVHGAPTN